MSSQGLPRLDIDVGQRRAERWIAVGCIASALLIPCLVDSWLAGVALALAAAVVLTAGFHRAGWLGGTDRIVRLVWFAEGHWLLLDSAGRAREASLAPDTRTGPGLLWLRWRVADPCSLLLLRGDLPAEQLRRLSVRLRIDRQQGECDTTPGGDVSSGPA